MENLIKIDMLKLSANLLDMIYETKHFNLKLLFFRVLNCCILSLVITYIYLNLFYVKGEAFLKSVQSSVYVLHILLKYLFFIYYKVDTEELLVEILKYFWDCRTFNKTVMEEIQKKYAAIEYIQKFMLFITGYLVLVYFSLPLWDKNHPFLLETYIPKSHAVGALLIISHYYYFAFAGHLVLGYDFLYFALCMHIVVQIRLLKEKLKDIYRNYSEKSIFEVNRCIQHHQFLFSLFLRMKNMYSLVLLFHYFSTLYSSCSMLFEILTGHTELTDYIFKGLLMFGFLIQFTYYALPAHQVASEFSEVSDAIYISEWYNSGIVLQTNMLFIMMKSRRMHYFSGGGLIDINIDALGSVLRKTLSFCAYIQNIINK